MSIYYWYISIVNCTSNNLKWPLCLLTTCNVNYYFGPQTCILLLAFLLYTGLIFFVSFYLLVLGYQCFLMLKLSHCLGLPGGSEYKESICNAGNGFDLLFRKSPWRRAWQPTPAFLPREFHGRGAWRTTVHGVAEFDMTEWLLLSQGNIFKCSVFLTQSQESPSLSCIFPL